MRDNNNEYGELDFLAGLKTDTIAESTAGAGVTIDGCLIKDGVTCGGLAPDDYWGRNLIKNSPGQIITDGAEPQWWDDTTDATITDEDTAGEGIPDIHERCFKVVTTANNEEGYQVLTFADEELLDAGVTVVSFGCWVYCASANKASIAIMGANLGVQESAQAGAGAWEWLEVENITLNAADASISVYLRVDTGTAYYTMPMLTVGPEAQPWKPRGLEYIAQDASTEQLNATTGDVAWSDTDCTATSDNLAVLIHLHTQVNEPNGNAGSRIQIGHSDTVVGADGAVARARVIIVGLANWTNGHVMCDDSQIIRYQIQEIDADNDVAYFIWIAGYWMWE